MKKIVLICFLSIISFPTIAYAASPWEGTWIYERYVHSLYGFLEITNCQRKLCDFKIDTANGAHTCSIKGKFNINGTTATYQDISSKAFCNDTKPAIITFELNPNKKTIEVKNLSSCNLYCGMQGVFEGQYENESVPLHYETSFDCQTTHLSSTQKTICATEHLAKADKEMHQAYPEMQTKKWLQDRDSCGTDINCLWDFYIQSIKNAYEQQAGKNFDLWHYIHNHKGDDLYYPTDFTLLDAYLRQNMEQKYYQEFVNSLDKIAIGINQCKDCLYHQYGVTGLFPWYSSAFYIDKDGQIWIAFVSANLTSPEDESFIVYAPKNMEKKDIPQKIKKWMADFSPPKKNIIIKHFSS